MNMNIDDKIPTGIWVLWYHSPRDKKWSIDSYTNIGEVSTWNELFSLLNVIGDIKLKGGMFFWMLKDIPPLWENYQNIRGGSYSLRGNVENGIEIFNNYTIACMLGIATSVDDKILGINISPKLIGGGNRDTDQTIGFYTIKIWNQDCINYNKPNGLKLINNKMSPDEIIYTPHNEKKM